MPFIERAPKDRKTSTPCMRRSCPFQRMLYRREAPTLDADFYLVFTYQCEDADRWSKCQRCIDPQAKDTRAEPEPPKSQTPPPVEPSKPEQVPTIGCPMCDFTAANTEQLDKHMDVVHRVTLPVPSEAVQK